MAFPCPSTDSLDPMDLFYTFDVSKVIPKNTHYLLYVTFNPFLTYITPKPAYIGMCAKGEIVLEFFFDVDLSHLSLGLPYALRSLGFDLTLPH